MAIPIIYTYGPDLEILEAAGGLHRFNGWDRPILTDSGGYQVFSLANNRKINEEGVIFQSHIDGSKHLFTPENVMDIQRIIGGDIIMAFDECPPYPSDYNYAKNSMELTHRWLDRCFETISTEHLINTAIRKIFSRSCRAVLIKDLRTASCEYIASKNATGNAIGGLSVGEPMEMMYEFTRIVLRYIASRKSHVI